MKRLLSAVFALSLLATTSAFAGASMKSSVHHTMSHSCPAGQHYVHGYRAHSGKFVKGYCRKG